MNKKIYKNQTFDGQGNLLHEEIIEVDVAPFSISKLSLRRILRISGLESVLNQMLNSSPEIRADWDDAPYLMSNDSLLIQMIPIASVLLQKTEQEVYELLESSKIN